jgi:hypothetical protein
MSDRQLTDARTNGHGRAFVTIGVAMLLLARMREPLEIWQGAAIITIGIMQMVFPWPWRKHT